MVKNKMNHDLQLNHFATISGIKGKQFGKEVFSTVLPFKDLIKFLTVFPDVQRELNQRKVRKIGRYTLDWVEDPTKMRFFPGITVTARGHIFYDEATHKVAIDTRESKLSINDGQHRFYGINEAIRILQGRINKTKDKEEITELTQQMNDLKEMVIPIVIFNNLSEEEEMQLFHDTNNLAQRPSRSATIRLAQTDPISRMARELAEENRYLVHYGVEYDKMSIQKNNPNTILLTSIYASIKSMFRELLKHNRDSITKKNYKSYKESANKTFDNIFRNLPADINEKGKYITEKSYTIQAIAKFVNYCRYILGVEDEDVIWEAIRKVNWDLDIDYWKQYRAIETKRGGISFGASGNHGIVAVFDALVDNLDADVVVSTDKKDKTKLSVKEPNALEGQGQFKFH
ncbi:DGQHR domain-containing protein (plasmid) [Cytobacillus oceanisediminis]|nr:DGQHR domain-containing protein [Cytobacillus oceanisediminis]